MKIKILTMVIIVIILTAGLVACSKNSNLQLEFTFDESGSYIGFESLPSEYTRESAEEDGLVIYSVFGVGTNEKVWNNFVRNAKAGKDSSVRMAYFSDESDYPYILDLLYREGSYYLFDSSANSLEKQPYKYLLTLKGQDGIPLRDSGVIVLSNDNSLTFDLVMETMYSSELNLYDFCIIMLMADDTEH